MRQRLFWWYLLVATLWTLLGCRGSTVQQRIDLEGIPRRPYKVTIHQSYSKEYAVLFDDPYDDKELAMMHTWYTKYIGMDQPDAYLERFRTRIRYFKTVRISEKDGTVRGYLVISKLLDYGVYKDTRRDKIMIRIIDPSLRARDPSGD